MPQNTDITASVIIPSYKQKHVIFDALDSVTKQETDFRYEIIIVESSGDDTAELVRQRFPDVHVIELGQRAFPGTARNAAIKKARGKFLAFTDTDCIIDKNWLQQLVDSHKRGYPVIGGMVRNGTPKNIFGTLDYLLEFSDLITPHETTDISHFGTCNVSFEKNIFANYGLFIDQVKGSDSLYCRLIREKGEPLFHQPKAVIWHRNRTNLKKIMRNQYELGYGAAINRHKYNLKGKIFVKYPILIPLLPFARIAAIGNRLLRKSFKDFVKFILLLPLVFVVLVRYTMGFAKGRKKALEQE
ncbi:MAG: glycosyltransferase [Actinobacteria bacterium]|nr:glycosyltransferase [Actinomycetota bacterium]